MCARLKLYGKMLEIGLDKIYYCDSDSLATSTPDKPEYSSSALGEWGLEAFICQARFFAPKLYYIKGYTPKGETLIKNRAKGCSLHT